MLDMVLDDFRCKITGNFRSGNRENIGGTREGRVNGQVPSALVTGIPCEPNPGLDSELGHDGVLITECDKMELL